MARRIRVHEHGGPEVLRLEAYEPPRPGPGEVLVRQTAVGLNFIDTYYRTGFYPLPLPAVHLGHRGRGRGRGGREGVSEVRVGERVAYAAQPSAPTPNARVPADRLVPLPDGDRPTSTAAAMMLKGMTAQYLLRQHLRACRPGDTVLSTPRPAASA